MDYYCADCKHEFNGPKQIHLHVGLTCPKCDSENRRTVKNKAVPIKPAVDQGWSLENGGRGRYISQLQQKPGPEGSERNAFCSSQNEAMEKAKRMGYNPVKVR